MKLKLMLGAAIAIALSVSAMASDMNASFGVSAPDSDKAETASNFSTQSATAHDDRRCRKKHNHTRSCYYTP